MNAIQKALSDSERSYALAKMAVNAKPLNVLTPRTSSGLFADQNSMQNAKSQLEAFRSWVFAAIRPICNVIAAQPIVVSKPARTLGTKDWTPLRSHPIQDLLANPNDLMTGWGLMWGTVASIMLTGKAFWWIVDNAQVLPIPASWVKGYTGQTSFESWKVQPPGHSAPIDIPSDQMVYFSLPDPGDPWGSTSPLGAVSESVNTDHDILRSQRSMFTRGIHPSHVVTVGRNTDDGPRITRPRLTATQREQIISAIKKRYVGAVNHNEPLILDGLIEDVKKLSHTPSEMDWQQSGDQVKDRILQAFGVSPYILGGSEPGSRAASAVAQKHFVQMTVNPLIRMMSEALTEWLVPIWMGDRKALRIDIEPAIADDDEMSLRRMTLAVQNQVVRSNELREFAGLPPDPEQDQVFAGVGTSRNKNPIMQGLRNLVDDAMADRESDSILEELRGERRHQDHDTNRNG